MKKILRCVFLVLSLTFFLATSAQKKNKIVITGTVKNAVGNPISNVLIFVDNLKQDQKTNANGGFSLKLKKEPTKITFLSLIHGSIDVTYIKDQNVMNVSFDNKESITVVKNNTEKEIEEENINKNIQTRNIFEYLSGRPGVEVNNRTIRIRGVTSLSSSTEPMFIINGKQETLTNVIAINPSDIKKLKILKTADELSIYGVRGGNGVIIIDTF